MSVLGKGVRRLHLLRRGQERPDDIPEEDGREQRLRAHDHDRYRHRDPQRRQRDGALGRRQRPRLRRRGRVHRQGHRRRRPWPAGRPRAPQHRRPRPIPAAGCRHAPAPCLPPRPRPRKCQKGLNPYCHFSSVSAHSSHGRGLLADRVTGEL